VCSAALKRDGRVLFVSSARCHGDGSGAQQMKDTGQGVVAPVLHLRVWRSDLEAAEEYGNGAGSFSRDAY
jgi:hypothetical protein